MTNIKKELIEAYAKLSSLHRELATQACENKDLDSVVFHTKEAHKYEMVIFRIEDGRIPLPKIYKSVKAA